MKTTRIAAALGIFAVVVILVILPAVKSGHVTSARNNPSSAAAPPLLSSRVAADDPSRDSLPPSILPVIILKGSDYEMGFQYGEQACAYIDRTREDKWAAALRRFSRDEVMRALQANQSFIRRDTPEWIDFMHGMADGATRAGYPMTYTDILLIKGTLPDPATSACVPSADPGPPGKRPSASIDLRQQIHPKSLRSSYFRDLARSSLTLRNTRTSSRCLGSSIGLLI